MNNERPIAELATNTTNLGYTVESRSTAYAKALFDRAKMRLLSVHEWPKYISAGNSGYITTDSRNNMHHHIVSPGDHVKPNDANGQQGLEVDIRDIRYEMPGRNAELLSVTLGIAGERSMEDSYLFILKREGSVVTVQYHANENSSIDLNEFLGFTPIQWGLLVKSIITFE